MNRVEMISLTLAFYGLGNSNWGPGWVTILFLLLMGTSKKHFVGATGEPLPKFLEIAKLLIFFKPPNGSGCGGNAPVICTHHWG